jgi:hypothetical protein
VLHRLACNVSQLSPVYGTNRMIVGTIVQKDSDKAEFDRMTEKTTAGRIGDMCISAVPRSGGPP